MSIMRHMRHMKHCSKKLLKKLLEELHKDHWGISWIKSVARNYIWWPGLDKATEEVVKRCTSCQAVKHSPAVAPVQQWTWLNQPWKRIYMDFVGLFQGSMFLVSVDAHFKWPRRIVMKETTVTKTIEILPVIFARFQLPEQVVTDNGPQFVLEDSSHRHFLKSN